MNVIKQHKNVLFALKNILHPSKRTATNSSIKQLLRSNLQAQNNVIKTQGWVKSMRIHKEIVFLNVSDGSCLKSLQIVVKPEILPSGVSFGSAISADGEMRASNHKHQPIELHAHSVNLIGSCDAKDYPLKARKQHSQEYMRQYLHLRPRSSRFGSLLRIRHAATSAIHDYFNTIDYLHVHSPVLTSNDCEGGGDAFLVQPTRATLPSSDSTTTNQPKTQLGGKNDFFGVPVFLTVSGQLQLEAVAGAFSKVYTFGPTFRAESSRGRHHLSEFYMIEAEMAFIDKVHHITDVIENLIKSVNTALLDNYVEDLEHIRKNETTQNSLVDIATMIENPFQRLSYTEAIDILKSHTSKFTFPVEWGNDLQKEHEKFLVQHTGGVPVFITDFPREIKPFYMKLNDDGRTVAAIDLLCHGVGEIAGGSLREHRLDLLQERLDQMNVASDYQWYMDLRRYGSAPHGGFGLGLERYLQALLGIDNIRDTIPFPRHYKNCQM